MVTKKKALPRPRGKRALAAMAVDPDSNPTIPPGGLSLTNNSDGTFIVRSRAHTVTFAAASAQLRRGGRRGGIVVAGVVGRADLPQGTIQVRDPEELASRLKAEMSAANIARAAGRTELREVHFNLKGTHTLDLGKLSAITGGQASPLATHIYIDPDDNSQIPPGG